MPISAFAHALRAFNAGDLTHDELSWEIDRQLAIEKASPLALLEVLKVQQTAHPLPNDAHRAIVDHLEEWPQDPTVVTGLRRKQRSGHVPNVGVGDILQGRFSLVALIGEGGMSRVFKAIDLRRVEAGASDPYVAVKVLTEPFGEYFGSMVALQRETHKLQSLTHPNIVRVIDCDRDVKTVFMTMEYLSGESLQKRLRGPDASKLDEVTAIALVAIIGEALEYAHRNRIVHGDLKPGNIIVTDDGVVKVIDFGMARFIARPDEGIAAEPSQATPKAVTPRYASPELVSGSDPEPPDDVYALACIAYETLSGRHPFGQQTDPRGRDPHERPSRPAGMRARHYAALVKGLAYDRRQRTPSVRQFLDELQASPRDWLKRNRVWLLLGALLIGIVAYGIRASRRQTDVARINAAPSVVPGAVLHDCPICPSLTVLPAGRFTQGSDLPSSGAYEKPAHAVVISHAFAMSSNEVTVAEFRDFAAATHRDLTGCTVYDGHWSFDAAASWQAPGFPQTDTHPVTCVSWEDATAYAAWISTKAAHAYRLPTASEWEYAARAGSEAGEPWGADSGAACTVANVADQAAAQRYPGWSAFPCNDRYVNTAPVGSYRTNEFGINDLLGNVFEWVQDCWHDDYREAPADGRARLDGSCEERESRGGSWFTSPQFVSVSYRNRFVSSYRSSAVGFRLVRDVEKR